MKTNSIVYKTNKILGNKHIFVTVRLNDECENGHQDFAITANIYEAGKPKTGRYYLSGGCCHDEILKAFPEFKIFVNLHLCDYKGIPMHAVANGYYHMHEGFNSKSTGEAHKSEYCEYYRVTPEQYEALISAPSKIQFALLLDKLGVLNQWEQEANTAIAELERLSGQTFLVDSKRTQYIAPTPEEIAEEEEKQRTGYYTPEAVNRRHDAKIKNKIAEMTAEAENKIKEIREELDLQIQVMKIAGEKAIWQFIYYRHEKKVKINWKDYDKISDEMANLLKEKLVLPEGVTFE